jgi:O-antigen/teichoic acid export membrane protein
MVIYAVADVIGKAMGLIISPFMTRLLTREEYGSFGLLSAVWTLVALLQFGGMDTSYQIFRVRQPDGQEKILTTATILATLSTLVTVALFSLVAFSGAWLINYAKVSHSQLGWYLVGLIPTILISWYLYIFRFQHKPIPFARTNLLSKVASNFIILPLLFLTPSGNRLTMLFAGIFVTQGLSLAWALRELRYSSLWPYSTRAFSSDLAFGMLRYGVPFIPGGVAYAAVVSVDRLIVGWLVGPKEAALVHLALNLGSVALMFKIWFSLVWNPSLVEWLGTKSPSIYLPKLQLALLGLSSFFFALTCLMAVWSDWLVAFLYPPEYLPIVPLVPFVVLATTFSTLSLVANGTILMNPSPKYHFITYICALIVTTSIGLLMVPRLGALGAILGTLGAELFILGSWILRGKFIKKDLNLNWRPVLIFGTMTAFFIKIYRPGLILPHEIFWERILITLIIVTLVVMIGYRMFRQYIPSEWHLIGPFKNQR